MTLLGEYEDADYLPEFGTLTVRDTPGEYVEGGLLEQWATDAQPCGTIARAGHGFLEAAAGDPLCVVQLRVHDGPPEDDGSAEWDDLVELPYRTGTGVIGLTEPPGGPGEEHLRLGAPGLYRVRVAYRDLQAPEMPEDTEDEEPESLWRLEFWAVEEVEQPRWLRRSGQAVVTGGDRGWGYLLEYQATDVLQLLSSARTQDEGTSVDELVEWTSTRSWGADWLDKPLVPTGSEHGMKLADVAAQVGQPAPTTRRMLLPLFTALGYLTFDGERYLRVPSPPLPQEVLEVPAELLTKLELSQGFSQFTSFASDLMTLAVWGGAEQTTAGALAERTLASEADVRAALGYAIRAELVRIDGDLTGEFTVTVLPVRKR